MTQVLLFDLYKAVSELTKAIKVSIKTLPVLNTIHLQGLEGVIFATRTNLTEAKRVVIPARLDADFSLCVPSKAFGAWLKVSRLEPYAVTLLPSPEKLRIESGTKQTGLSVTEFNAILASEYPIELALTLCANPAAL